MQTYDLLMLSILGGLALYGYFKGMAWQIAYLASFIVSYFVATRFDDQFAPLFGDAAPWNKLIALAVIYAATSFAIWMLFRVVRSGIDSAKLNSFDRQMGVAVGLLRGAAWCLGITFVSLTFVSQVFPGVRGHIIQSRSGHYIAKFIDESRAIFPEEVHQVIGPYLEQIDRGLDPSQQPAAGFGGQPTGFGGQPSGFAAPPPAGSQPGGGFFENLSGQVSQGVDQLRNSVQTGLQNELRNQVNAGLQNAGLAPQPGAPSPPAGLPAWPASQPAPATPRPGTPATPAGWPAPPPGTGWPVGR